VVVMKKHRCRSAFGAMALFALSLIAVRVAAQETPPATLRVATLLSADAPLDEKYWAASLDRAIANSARVIDVRRSDGAGSGGETTGNLITVVVSAKVVADGVKTDWRIIDPVDGSVFAKGIEEGSVPSQRILDEIYWINLVEALERWDMLTIEAEPGTRIEGIGSESILIGESGQVKLLVEQPKIYRWKAIKSGMATKTGILALPNGDTPLKITLQPLHLWAVEAALRLAFFPELRLYRGLVEDRLFVRMGFAQSLWAFRFAAEEDELFRSAYGGRFEPNLGYGFYFFGVDHGVRPYVSMDLSLRLLHTKDAFLYFELPDAFRLTPSFGMDFAFSSRASGFAEAGIDLLGRFDDELGAFNGRIGTRVRF
jgi:hypothetical protein